MKKLLILSFFLFPIGVFAQDLLILEKGHDEVRSYSIGSPLTMKTIYDQWFDGNITDLRHDSVYLNGQPFHYKEIAEIRRERTGLNYETDGTLLMIAGGGVFALGAINGAIRGDNSNSWYTASGIVTGAALIVGGLLLRKARTQRYVLGRRFKLNYLVLNPKK